MLIPAAGFFLVAAVTRYEVRHIESRLQILAFGCVALLFELARRASRGDRGGLIRSLALDMASISAAVLIVKIHTEHIHVDDALAWVRMSVGTVGSAKI